MSKKKLAPSTLKSRRRRKPLYIDEPIQWHLRNSRNDRCPWCGLSNLGYLGARKRTCMNSVCGINPQLPGTQKEWTEAKMAGEKTVTYGSPQFSPEVRHEHRDIVGTLADAQFRSDAGRAFVVLKVIFDRVKVFWHRAGHVPEDESGERCMAPGSPYWYFILGLREEEVWVPDQPLNEMEVLAKAYGTDEPMFSISTTRGS